MQNTVTLCWTKGIVCEYANYFTHSCGLSGCRKYNLSPSVASSSTPERSDIFPTPSPLPEELIINGITYIKKEKAN